MATWAMPSVPAEMYLDRERTALDRHEYIDGDVRQVGGESLCHALVVVNLASELSERVAATSALIVAQSVRVRVPGNHCIYPDIMAICGEPQFADHHKDMIVNPTLLIEVLSPGTEGYDRGAKFAQYRRVASLREYVLVAQHEARVEMFRLQADGQWLYTEYVGLDAVCEFKSLECKVSLAQIYGKVTLDKATLDIATLDKAS